MYRQALKNMYKAAADETTAALPDGSKPLTMSGMIAPDWLQFVQNYYGKADSDYPVNVMPGLGPYGNIIPLDHTGPLTGDVYNPTSGSVAGLARQGLDGPSLPEEGQPLTGSSFVEKKPEPAPEDKPAPKKPADEAKRNALIAALADKSNYGALAALSAAGLGGLGGAAFGGNANDRILNAITGAAGGAGAVGGARGAMELLEGSKVDPLLAAGLGGVTGGIGSGALARLLAKTLMK